MEILFMQKEKRQLQNINNDMNIQILNNKTAKNVNPAKFIMNRTNILNTKINFVKIVFVSKILIPEFFTYLI